MNYEDEIKAISSFWTCAGDKRICAICLKEVDRIKYDDHMLHVHGYETISLNFYCDCQGTGKETGEHYEIIYEDGETWYCPNCLRTEEQILSEQKK